MGYWRATPGHTCIHNMCMFIIREREMFSFRNHPKGGNKIKGGRQDGDKASCHECQCAQLVRALFPST